MKKYVLLLALLIILAACQKDNDFEEPEIITETEEKDVDEEPVVDEKPVQATGEKQGISPKDELKKLLDTKPEFKAEYDVKNIVKGEETTGTQLIAITKDNSKMESEGESFYVIGENVYFCLEEEEVNCYDVPQEQPPAAVNVSIPEGTSVKRLPDKKVAGKKANCYELVSEDSRYIDCRSEEGILLYYLRESQDYSLEMTAKTVSEVTSEDFELPAEPQEFNPEDFQNAQPR